LFYYDTTYSRTTYDHSPSINTNRSTELAAIFVGKLTSLSAATWWTYDSNRRYSIWIENSTDLWVRNKTYSYKVYQFQISSFQSLRKHTDRQKDTRNAGTNGLA